MVLELKPWPGWHADWVITQGDGLYRGRQWKHGIWGSDRCGFSSWLCLVAWESHSLSLTVLIWNGRKKILLQRSRSGLNEKSTHEGAKLVSTTVRCSADIRLSLSLDKKYEVLDSYFWWEEKNAQILNANHMEMVLNPKTEVSFLRGK